MRKKLIEAGIDDFSVKEKDYCKIRKWIIELREKGFRYQQIADKFNSLKIPTRSKSGKWYAKTVRDIVK